MNKYRIRKFKRDTRMGKWGAWSPSGRYVWGTSGRTAAEAIQALCAQIQYGDVLFAPVGEID